MENALMKNECRAAVALVLASAALVACARQPEASAGALANATSSQLAAASRDAPEATRVHVHKSASCGCCSVWIEHMRDAGFTVTATDVANVNAVKERVGVPLGKGSCHTAEVGGYFIEGHVPAADVKRLLAGRPDAKGLVVPGMPAGSPGMEMPDGRTQPYTVELVHADGSTEVFARHQQQGGGHPNAHEGH